MMFTFTSPKFRTRFYGLALLAAGCLPGVAHANGSTVLTIGATVLPPACVASTDIGRVNVKCGSAYSAVTRMENDAMAGQGIASQPSLQRTPALRADFSNGGQRRMTVTY